VALAGEGRRTIVDWAATLRKEARRSAILKADDIARRYGIVEIAVGNALRRQERRGLVEHVSNKIYINKLAHDFSSRDLVNLLRLDAYISLESALAEWGISTQSPSGLTCVTTGFPRKFRTASVRIIFRHISKRLYWGFKEKRTRHGVYKIAEPEKALLDWIYLKRQEGLPVALDELNLSAVDKGKLLEYASRYPKPVRESLLTVLWTSEREPWPQVQKPTASKGVGQANQIGGQK
jgi:predicted transcriptional regulator of viral defense system